MKKYNLAQISFLIACGSALQLAESFIAYPIPGIRIGLANLSTIIGLVVFGLPAALEVAVFRPIVTSLTNGTFLSPIFVLNFFGSLSSFVVMALTRMLIWRKRSYSIFGMSILGGVAQNVFEIAIAYFWLIPHKGIFALTPILVVLGVVGGYFVGRAGNYVVEKIDESKLDRFTGLEKSDYDKPVIALSISDKLRILAAFTMIISTIFLKSLKTYSILILILVSLIIIFKENVRVDLKRISRLWGVILFSFILPVLFSANGAVLWHWKLLKITETGLYDGGLFAIRLIFLIFISIWIGVGEPSKLSQELAWILSPLKYFHFSVDRIPRLTSLSLSFIPVIWEKLTHVKPKTLRTVLDVLVAFFIGLEQ